MQQVHSSPPRRLNFNAKTDADVSVATGANTTIFDMDVSQIARLALQITNPGANALDSFIVQGKVNTDGDLLSILTVAADYTTPAGIVVDASGDLTALAAGATGWLILDVLALNMIRITASAAVGATTLRIFAGGA